MPEVDVALSSHLLQQTKKAENHRERPSSTLCQPRELSIDEPREDDEYQELLRLVSSSFVNRLLMLSFCSLFIFFHTSIAIVSKRTFSLCF